MSPLMYGTSAWDLLYCNLQEPRISTLLLDFWRICTPLKEKINFCLLVIRFLAANDVRNKIEREVENGQINKEGNKTKLNKYKCKTRTEVDRNRGEEEQGKSKTK
jgi:hypothetical protein